MAYPFDVLKARMMVSDKNQGLLQTAKQVYHENGVTGFTRGFAPCVLRAFPANGAAFFGFEMAMKFMNGS